MADYEQLPEELNISLVKGDDFSYTHTFTTDLSGFTFDAPIKSAIGDVYAPFTVSGYLLASGMVNISLTSEQTELLPNSCTWYIQQHNGLDDRTLLFGQLIVKDL